ncbi:MAG: hypothetical protein JWO77_1638 [Ilumatobacteraceae bacterium]|nr:hypothetical protein [Ilumatobacteraceae bacterium]
MQDIRGRRAQVLATAAVAVALLVGAAGCGGGSSDSSSSSDGGTKTSQDSGDKTSKSGGSSDDAGSGELPNPCDLVPIEKASEILGGESAEPEAESGTGGLASKSCSWQTQASIDDPTLDGAGHVLLLQTISPPETMEMDDFWKASAGAADESADIDGCDEAFWLGGLLSALKDGVYLTASAGLADSSEDAKASVTDLVSTACGNI